MSAKPITVGVRRLPHAAGLPLPEYGSAGAAGLDLIAALASEIVLAPGARAVIPAGIEIAVPAGFEAQVRPRSGLALKAGVTVLNAPGTIDSDYRGEVGVILVNHGTEPFTVSRGMRVAQLVVAPVSRIAWNESAELPQSARGTGGFGSTGAGAKARSC